MTPNSRFLNIEQRALEEVWGIRECSCGMKITLYSVVGFPRPDTPNGHKHEFHRVEIKA